MGIKRFVAVVQVPVILMAIAGGVAALAVVMTRDREPKQPASQLAVLDLATAYPEWVGSVSAQNIEQYRIAACAMTERFQIDGVTGDDVPQESAYVLFNGIPGGSTLEGLYEGIRGWGYLFTRFQCTNPATQAQVNMTGVWLTVFGPEWIDAWTGEVSYPLVGVEQ